MAVERIVLSLSFDSLYEKLCETIDYWAPHQAQKLWTEEIKDGLSLDERRRLRRLIEQKLAMSSLNDVNLIRPSAIKSVTESVPDVFKRLMSQPQLPPGVVLFPVALEGRSYGCIRAIQVGWSWSSELDLDRNQVQSSFRKSVEQAREITIRCYPEYKKQLKLARWRIVPLFKDMKVLEGGSIGFAALVAWHSWLFRRPVSSNYIFSGCIDLESPLHSPTLLPVHERTRKQKLDVARGYKWIKRFYLHKNQSNWEGNKVQALESFDDLIEQAFEGALRGNQREAYLFQTPKIEMNEALQPLDKFLIALIFVADLYLTTDELYDLVNDEDIYNNHEILPTLQKLKNRGRIQNVDGSENRWDLSHEAAKRISHEKVDLQKARNKIARHWLVKIPSRVYLALKLRLDHTLHIITKDAQDLLLENRWKLSHDYFNQLVNQGHEQGLWGHYQKLNETLSLSSPDRLNAFNQLTQFLRVKTLQTSEDVELATFYLGWWSLQLPQPLASLGEQLLSLRDSNSGLQNRARLYTLQALLYSTLYLAIALGEAISPEQVKTKTYQSLWKKIRRRSSLNTLHKSLKSFLDSPKFIDIFPSVSNNHDLLDAIEKVAKELNQTLHDPQRQLNFDLFKQDYTTHLLPTLDFIKNIAMDLQELRLEESDHNQMHLCAYHPKLPNCGIILPHDLICSLRFESGGTQRELIALIVQSQPELIYYAFQKPAVALIYQQESSINKLTLEEKYQGNFDKIDTNKIPRPLARVFVKLKEELNHPEQFWTSMSIYLNLHLKLALATLNTYIDPQAENLKKNNNNRWYQRVNNLNLLSAWEDQYKNMLKLKQDQNSSLVRTKILHPLNDQMDMIKVLVPYLRWFTYHPTGGGSELESNERQGALNAIKQLIYEAPWYSQELQLIACDGNHDEIIDLSSVNQSIPLTNLDIQFNWKAGKVAWLIQKSEIHDLTPYLCWQDDKLYLHNKFKISSSGLFKSGMFHNIPLQGSGKRIKLQYDHVSHKLVENEP